LMAFEHLNAAQQTKLESSDRHIAELKKEMSLLREEMLDIEES